MAGDKNGVPSIGVMTTKFVSAADLMSRVLGAEGYRYVVIEHPISSATDDMLAEQARKAAADSAAILTGAPA